MKIKNIISRNRRDFHAIYVCEHCSAEHKSYGYDDAHFHQNVIPNMTCDACGEKSPDNFEPEQPRYPEGMQV